MVTRPGYIYGGPTDGWVSIGQDAAVSPFKYQATAPTSPATGDIWIDSSSTVNSIDSTQLLRWRKTMVGGETSLSGNDDASLPLTYTPGYEQLYINGVLQVRGVDYTATTGTTVTGLTALVANDVVEVFSAVARAVSDVYTQSQSDARFVNKNVGGLNLVVPTSVGVGSGSGSVATNGQITFTGATYIDLNGVFSSAYDNYKVEFQYSAVTTNDQITYIILRNSSGNIAGSNWSTGFSYVSWTSGTTNFLYQNGAASGYLPLVSGSSSSTSFDVFRPFLSTATSFSGHGAGFASAHHGSGRWSGSDSATGMRIDFGSGGSSSGTIRIYGYNNGA